MKLFRFNLLVWILAMLFACGTTESSPVDNAPDTARSNEPVPFSTTEDYLTVYREDGHEPLFIKGTNLGVAVPGTSAGELAASRKQYDRWLDQMRKLGVNTVRVYTLHYPRFYEALAQHNRQHPDNPIYLLNGVWLVESTSSDDLYQETDNFRRRIREAVDCMYGECRIDHRFGEAYGTFDADVSQWVIGWIIGREVTPAEVQETNDEHSDVEQFDGEHFRTEEASPTEVWLAEQLEYLVDYEKQNYDKSRPVSVSSWPTLDPLNHPTEGRDYSDEDVTDFDLMNIEVKDHPGGLFASFHAYPYYPNFIRNDPGYLQYSDDRGPNSYLGYPEDLKKHHESMPLLIAEVGVPNGWINAHSGHTGMNHGGHTEIEQGEANARLLESTLTTDCAGGVVFAWIDEWWKPTWIVDPRDFPKSRRKLWHNVASPEQNFGLIDFELPEPKYGSEKAAKGDGEIESAVGYADAAFFHAKIELKDDFEAADRLVVGFDTYGDDIGESKLPDGTFTENRNEFALVIEGSETATLRVTDEYNLVGIWHNNSDEDQLYRSVKSDDGEWELFRIQNQQPHGSNDGEYYWGPGYFDAGKLGIREEDEQESNLDAVVIRGDRIDIRLPWTFLHFTDPSQRHVMDDDRDTPEGEVSTSDGIALSVSLNSEHLLESARYSWDTWDEAPETTERTKRSAPVLSEALQALPGFLEEE